MKDNRKNRKLNFIRHKNNLRLGKTKFYCKEKVSNQTDILNTKYWEDLTTTAIKSLYKEYRLKLNIVQMLPKQIIGDDFVKDLHTNCIILSRT